MLEFEKFSLDNGLRVILNKDRTTPMAIVNLLYDVGARDENPDRTGFAHLFEHLMFEGSANIPEFDTPLQNAGGTNNAFTNNDFTNYYISLPKENIETALWLESDRMLSLDFKQKKLETQRKVVIEEYKQRYLNRPYGDTSLLLRPLAYKVHPYRWATIGKDIEHIEQATMQEVKDFFFSRYAPNNAILSISGNFEVAYIKEMVEKWFGNIEKRAIINRDIPPEPPQKSTRRSEVMRDVPADSLHKVYHTCGRTDKNYQAIDLLSDIFGMGDSARLYQRLVKDRQIFNDTDAYISGSIDPGLFSFSGKPAEGVSLQEAEKALDEEISKIITKAPSKEELQKVKNKFEAKFRFGEQSALNNALNLAFFELISKAEDYNSELDKYLKVKEEDIQRNAAEIFRPENASVLYYKAKNKS